MKLLQWVLDFVNGRLGMPNPSEGWLEVGAHFANALPDPIQITSAGFTMKGGFGFLTVTTAGIDGLFGTHTSDEMRDLCFAVPNRSTISTETNPCCFTLKFKEFDGVLKVEWDDAPGAWRISGR